MVRRSGRVRERRASAGVRQLPWREVVNPYAPIEVLSADQLEAIHNASLDLLESNGMRFLHAEARQLLANAGAEVDEDSMLVKFDRGLVKEKVALAPSEFVLRARNPAHSLRIGGNRIAFTAVGGPAFCNDLDRGRRTGTYDDLCDFTRLVQSVNIIHQEGGGGFEAMDLPPESRHLDLYLAQCRFTDKNCQAYPLGRARTVDAIEMSCINLGTDREGLVAEPAVFGIINTNSPLQLDIPMSEATIELASAGQVVCVTPFTLAGAMAPATMAGTLVQQNAEVLAVITLAEIVNPGAPIMYGAFCTNVDMRTGSPAFGTPEYARMTQASGQLARRYSLPFRSSNTTASNVADAQATYESAMSLWGAITAHANLVNHAAGWLEGGLTASYEKLIIDAEMLQLMAEYLVPMEVNDDALALDAIKSVGPGGHFFGAAHTLDRYETAFYAPMLSDWRNFETWEEAGSIDTTQRANAIWKQLLSDYKQPPLDSAVEETLVTYVARRKEKIKASM